MVRRADPPPHRTARAPPPRRTKLAAFFQHKALHFICKRVPTEPTWAHLLIEVTDDVACVQLAEELPDAQAIPHATPAGCPALAPAADGDLALA